MDTLYKYIEYLDPQFPGKTRGRTQYSNMEKQGEDSSVALEREDWRYFTGASGGLTKDNILSISDSGARRAGKDYWDGLVLSFSHSVSLSPCQWEFMHGDRSRYSDTYILS